MSLRPQRLPPTIQIQSEKFPRFRGVFAVGVSSIRIGDGGSGQADSERDSVRDPKTDRQRS